jgi:hypothetical protein
MDRQSWTLTLPAEVVEAIHRVAGDRSEAVVLEAIQHELQRRVKWQPFGPRPGPGRIIRRFRTRSKA